MPVNVHLTGEGIEFEREVSVDIALKIIEICTIDVNTVGEAQQEQGEQETEASTESEHPSTSSLPSNFFTRLSAKQEALLGVLNDADEPISSSELQRQMQEEYDEAVGGGRGVAGILQGFTKKYGDSFNLIRIDWGNHEGYYQLNPDRPRWVKEIEEHFND